MKKKLLAMLLSLSMVASMLPTMALAAEYTSGSCGDNATWSYDKSSQTLTISGSGAMDDYSCEWGVNLPPWLNYGWDDVKYVIVESGITRIGKEAFGSGWAIGAQNTIVSISLPSTLDEIGNSAFASTSIREIVLPSSLSEIGYSVFDGCYYLEEITIPNSNSYFYTDEGVLYAKENDSYYLYCYPQQKTASSYSIPDGVTTSAYYGFNYNQNIKSVTIPSSFEEVGNLMFLDCTNLETVTLNEGLESIDFNAFWMCDSLNTITLPKSVQTINSGDDLGPAEIWYSQRTLDVYFQGTTAPTFTGFSNFTDGLLDGSCVTLYYPEDASGWNSVISDADSYIADGKLKFESYDDSVSSSELRLLSTTLNDEQELELTFSDDLATNFNWLDDRAIYIKDYDTDEIVLTIEDTMFYSLPCSITGNVLTIPLDGILATGNTYYVLVDDGLILSDDYKSFSGIDQKETVYFYVDGNFVLGSDNNSFIHNSTSRDYGFYGVENYSLTGDLYDNLVSNASISEILSIWAAMTNDWGGSCYGIAATMGLIKSGELELTDISSVYASSYYNLALPWTESKLLDAITYYQLSQHVVTPTEYEYGENYDVVLEALIDSLKNDEISIFCYGYYSDGSPVGHAILAVDVTADMNGDYIVTLYDMNSTTTYSSYFTQMIVSSDYETFAIYAPNQRLIDNDTCRYLKYTDLDEFNSLKEPYSSSNGSLLEKLIIGGTEFSVSNSDGILFSIDDEGNIDNLAEGVSIVNSIEFGTADESQLLSAQLYVEIPSSNAITVLSSGENFEVCAYSEETYLSASGNNIGEVCIDLESGISLSGIGETTVYDVEDDTYTFEAYMSTMQEDEESLNLISIQATANDNTVISVDNTSNLLTVTSNEVLINPIMTSIVGVNSTILEDANPEDGIIVVSTIIEPTTSSSGSSSGSSTTYYDIDLSYTGEGSVTPATTRMAKNTSKTFYFTPDDGYEISDVLVNGESVGIVDSYTISSIKADHSIEVIFAESKELVEAIAFTDVDSDAYYFDAVLWAVENGITSGTTDTTFSPDNTCTRAQAVTFLYRAAGEPDVSGIMTFTDVDADAYYYDAVLWAVANGITAGTTDTTFSPEAVCSRSQIVTFMYRAAGEPEVTGTSDFTDVSADMYYYDAVLWAVSEGITNGTGDSSFSPDEVCTRSQIVTFLYRYIAE